MNRDGSGNRRLWQREHRDQWITHESWLAGRRELAFVDWPNGMRAIDVDSGAIRWITRFPARHAHPDDTGHWIVCDTHPHPRPSPDGKRVLYTSDATGHAQLYECWLES